MIGVGGESIIMLRGVGIVGGCKRFHFFISIRRIRIVFGAMGSKCRVSVGVVGGIAAVGVLVVVDRVAVLMRRTNILGGGAVVTVIGHRVVNCGRNCVVVVGVDSCSIEHEGVGGYISIGKVRRDSFATIGGVGHARFEELLEVLAKSCRNRVEK